MLNWIRKLMTMLVQRARKITAIFNRNGRRDKEDLQQVAVPVFSIGAAVPSMQAEGNSGSVAYSFPVTRSVRIDLACSVQWAVSGTGGNPTNSGDFTGATSGTLTFAAGETAKIITVRAKGDLTVEPNEGFVVTLSNPSAGTLGTATSTATIENDDSVGGGGSYVPSLQFNDARNSQFLPVLGL